MMDDTFYENHPPRKSPNSTTAPKSADWMADTNDLRREPSPFGAGILPAENTAAGDSGVMGEGIVFTAAEILDFADGADSYS